ncbi:MAG: hypothetical protein AB7G21_08580 [Dehalococcoidia bacterium]
MSTWPTARAALASHLEGLQITVSGLEQETLKALEWAPSGRQDATLWPYGFVFPTGETVTRASGVRRTTRELVFRLMLSPTGAETTLEVLQKRYDAWKEALKDSMDSAITIDGAATVFGEQSFGELEPYDDIDKGWGFEMRLGALQFHEAKTFSG